MFERFTSRARRVVVRAQEESRRAKHNYIGTEHVLLGLLGEADGLAGQVLTQHGVTLDAARECMLTHVGPGKKAPAGHIPFTPRAKKVLELALREALSMQHNYIGTEHILLGVIREGDGLGAQMLRDLVEGGDLLKLRMAVLDAAPSGEPRSRRGWFRRRDPDQPVVLEDDEELRTTQAAEASLRQATELAGGAPVGSQHLMLAAITDEKSAAARALAGAGIDLEAVRAALRGVDLTGTSDELPEEAGRRSMLIRLADENTLRLESADPALVTRLRATLSMLGGAEVEGAGDGEIRGAAPTSSALAGVWQALVEALDETRKRAWDIVQESERAKAAQAEVEDAEPGEAAEPGDAAEPGEGEGEAS